LEALSSLSLRTKVMEKVFPNETGQPLPRSLQKYEANNSFKTKILAFIGAHEFFQR